ncbi:MAG: DUF423 domain-containing protein [Pirellulaceae bacterium]
MSKFNLILGTLFGLLAVIAGAAGDHLVKEILDEEFKARGEAAAALENEVGGNTSPEVDEETAEETPSGATEEEENPEDPQAAEEARNADLPTETPSRQVPNYAAERAERLDTFNTATRYQMYHSLAMVALGAMLLSSSRGAITGLLAGVLFLVGQVLFSGTLYLVSIYDMQELTWLVPFGGTSFIAGWAFFLLAAIQVKPLNNDD